MNAEQTTSALWTTPDAVRTAPRFLNVEADAAQRMINFMDATPLSSPLTSYDWEILAATAERDAQTSYMNRLAEW